MWFFAEEESIVLKGMNDMDPFKCWCRCGRAKTAYHGYWFCVYCDKIRELWGN